MVSFRFAWLLLRQRLWQSFQTALGVALLILAALAGLSWYAQRMQMLNQQKAAFTLHLVLASEITDDQARALASDLRALAPSLLASVELLSDTAWIERLQSRYGIALNELSGERIFPLALRVRFVPEQMTQAAVAAFIEQCAQVSMIRTINFSPRMLASLAEGESNLQQQSLMLGLGWLALATLGQLLQLRTTLPFPAAIAKRFYCLAHRFATHGVCGCSLRLYLHCGACSLQPALQPEHGHSTSRTLPRIRALQFLLHLLPSLLQEWQVR